MTVPNEAIRRQFFALLSVYINVFIMGCGLGWISNAIYFLQNGNEISATGFQIALIASSMEIGRLMSAIPAGILVDKFGRKKIIIWAGISHCFSWLTISINSSLITIYIFRFVLGITASLIHTTSFTSIGEIASPEIRGKLAGIYSISLFGGIISPSIITVLFSSYFMLSYITTVLSFLFFISMYWIIETPSYLISDAKLNQAKTNLQLLRLGYPENYITNEFKKLQNYIEVEKLCKKETKWLQFISSDTVRKPLTIISLLSFFTGMNGIITISIYSTQIWPNVGFVPVHYYPLVGYSIQLFMSMFAILYIDRYSRRQIFITGASIIALIMAFSALIDYWLIENILMIPKWMLLTCNVLAIVVNAGLVQPTYQATISEILPQASKGFGGSLNIIASAVAITFSYFIYYLTNKNSNLYYLYAIFSIDSVILCVLVYFYLPESCGKMLADLQMEFKKQVQSKEYLALTKRETI